MPQWQFWKCCKDIKAYRGDFLGACLINRQVSYDLTQSPGGCGSNQSSKAVLFCELDRDHESCRTDLLAKCTPKDNIMGKILQKLKLLCAFNKVQKIHLFLDDLSFCPCMCVWHNLLWMHFIFQFTQHFCANALYSCNNVAYLNGFMPVSICAVTYFILIKQTHTAPYIHKLTSLLYYKWNHLRLTSFEIKGSAKFS